MGAAAFVGEASSDVLRSAGVHNATRPAVVFLESRAVHCGSLRQSEATVSRAFYDAPKPDVRVQWLVWLATCPSFHLADPPHKSRLRLVGPAGWKRNLMKE